MNCMTCDGRHNIYICKNNHKICQDCTLYKGVSRTNEKQHLPSLQPHCNICSEVSNLNQIDITLERDRLNNAIEKLIIIEVDATGLMQTRKKIWKF